jgi:hypothetical protein
MAKRARKQHASSKQAAVPAPKIKRPIDQYDHKDKKRTNNPPVGLVTNDTEPSPRTEPKKTYAYDPNLDPRLEWERGIYSHYSSWVERL